MNFFSIPLRPRAWLLAAGLAAALAGCGGSDSGPAATTLGGTAAVGVPIVGGTVNVSCAGGSALSTTTGSTGAWQVTIAGQTLPCAVRVTGGTVGSAANAQPLHSFAVSFGTLNITPLTDLIVANLAGTAPGAWFNALTANSFSALNTTTLDAARTRIVNALGMSGTLGSANPLTTAFTATNGNLIDDILEALATALNSAGTSYATLLSNAVSISFSAPSGFNFGTAYTGVVGVNTGGSGSGAGTLVVSVTVFGVTSSSTISGVANPGSAFCSSLQNDASLAALGSLTINSCSFSGNVGTVNATVIASGLSIPYTIVYTYN